LHPSDAAINLAQPIGLYIPLAAIWFTIVKSALNEQQVGHSINSEIEWIDGRQSLLGFIAGQTSIVFIDSCLTVYCTRQTTVELYCTPQLSFGVQLYMSGGRFIHHSIIFTLDGAGY
jgi:hypothetical protein